MTLQRHKISDFGLFNFLSSGCFLSVDKNDPPFVLFLFCVRLVGLD